LGAVKPSNCDPDQIIVLETGVDFPWHILPAGQTTAVMFHELQFSKKKKGSVSIFDDVVWFRESYSTS
jgi:hypothetical protein